MVNKPLISVIVPVYGVEAYLSQCLDSLIQQTYPNLEIILVDDGSPDACGEICDIYAQKRDNIIVIHQENKGLCGARNTGLAAAHGEYIGFIDSDDWCKPDMYEYLMKNQEQYDADVIACRYYRVIPGKETTARGDGTDLVFTKEEVIYEIVKKFRFRTVFWNKIFKREIFDGLSFPEGRTFEGTLFMHKVLEKGEKFVLLGDPKYYYRDTEDSIVNSKKLAPHVNYVVSNISRYYDLRESYPELRYSLLKSAVDAVLGLPGHYRKMAGDGMADCEELFQIIQTFILENDEEIKRYCKSKTKRKQLSAIAENSYSGYKKAHDIAGVNKRLRKLKGIFKISRKKKRSTSKKKTVPLMTPSRQEKLHQLQGVLVEILDVIDDICRKNNITYYLYGGTLLGAVRDGKIIAWDDDMDIVMLREDYNKFKEVCKTQLPEQYYYQDCFTDEAFPMLFAKIRKNGTYVKEEKWDKREMHKGIFVDILPLDYFPSNPFYEKYMLKWMNFQHQVCAFQSSKSKSRWKKALFAFAKMLSPKTRYAIRDKSIQFCNKIGDKENVCSFGSHYQPMKRRVLKTEWFGTPTDIYFEGKMRMAPEHGEMYLTHLFGENYMELPPEEKRVCHGDMDSIIF